MKDPGDRTKVVLRHLPPTLSQAALKDQIDARFAGRYNWFSFRVGRASHLNQPYSRAYIEFKRAEDVIDFAGAFDGHLFLNEKGTHFKTIVEYAPSQRVPKSWIKKDTREGAIFKDSEYLEFLDLLAKPVENLPSAEVQLERREAERAASGTRDNLIVTPLMDYVRQKRAAKSGSQRSASSGKLGRRAGGASTATSSAVGHRRGPERRRTATATYVLRDNTRIASNKDKSTYFLSPRREDQQHIDSDMSIQVVSRVEELEDGAGAAGKTTVSTVEGTVTGTEGSGEVGKKKMLLLKSKDKESTNGRITEASFSNSIGVAVQPQKRQMSSIKGVSLAQHHGGSVNQQGMTSPVRGSPLTSFKLHQRREPSGRTVKGILVNKDFQQPQSLANLQSEQQNQVSYAQKDEKLATIDLHAVANIAEKHDRRMRNKDRPDRPVWTPRRRSDGAFGADESQPYISSDCTQLSSDVVVPIRSEVNVEGVSQFHHGPTLGLTDFSIEDNLSVDNFSPNPSGALGKSRLVESTGAQIVRSNRMNSNTNFVPCLEQSSIQGEQKSEMLMTSRTGENGNHRQIMRRPLPLGLKELDSSLNAPESKSSKRGGASGYGNHEKQVWVAVHKSGSGS